MTILEIYNLKTIGIFTPLLQLILIAILLLIAVVTQHKEYKKTGKTYGRYPFRVSTFLSSVYEEIIFRGLILIGLFPLIGSVAAVAISSILFGLWHVKNYKWQTRSQTLYQVFYTGVIFGPIAAIVTLWTGTIWIAVIIHYIHNILVDVVRKRAL